MADYDIAIIGGGCVGCSVAKHLAETADLDVSIIEKEHHLAEHQSGRNSGVLHPGFNYEPGSLKAQFSTEGTRRMKAYCRETDVPLKEFGVVVLATNDAEESRLHEIQTQATENGVETIILEDPPAIEEHEPHASGQAALFCPEAASVDAQQYVYALAADAKNAGVDFYMGYRVTAVRRTTAGYEIHTTKGRLTAAYLINAAGLYADTIAHQMEIGEGYQIVPFRGEYYELIPEKRSLVKTMIYPVPDPELPFLGVHFTRRADDKVIVGPNAVLAFGREAYRNTSFDIRELSEIVTYPGFWRLIGSRKMLGIAWDELRKSYRKERFVAAARRLVPEVQREDFVRSYAGVRAQLVSEDGTLVKDPMTVAGDRSLHILNAVSPGLTSSLPFGEYIAIEALDAI